MNINQLTTCIVEAATNAAVQASIRRPMESEADRMLHVRNAVQSAVSILADKAPVDFVMPTDLSTPQDPVGVRLQKVETLLKKIANSGYQRWVADELTPEEQEILNLLKG